FLDFEGKKIAILESSVYLSGDQGVEKYLEAFDLQAQIVKVPEQRQVFELLNSGEADIGIVSRIFALTNRKDFPDLKETGVFLNPTELHFALTKGASENSYLIERLDYWVKKLKDGYGGVFQQILGQ